MFDLAIDSKLRGCDLESLLSTRFPSLANAEQELIRQPRRPVQYERGAVRQRHYLVVGAGRPNDDLTRQRTLAAPQFRREFGIETPSLAKALVAVACYEIPYVREPSGAAARLFLGTRCNVPAL